MEYENLLEIIISNKKQIILVLSICVILYHLHFLYRLEKFRKKEWAIFANSNNCSLYKRSWMAMNTRTGLLEGGTTPHPYSYALKHRLVPENILNGYSEDGQRKCKYF